MSRAYASPKKGRVSARRSTRENWNDGWFFARESACFPNALPGPYSEGPRRVVALEANARASSVDSPESYSAGRRIVEGIARGRGTLLSRARRRPADAPKARVPAIDKEAFNTSAGNSRKGADETPRRRRAGGTTVEGGRGRGARRDLTRSNGVGGGEKPRPSAACRSVTKTRGVVRMHGDPQELWVAWFESSNRPTLRVPAN
jgi:hypothetical protein